MSSLTSTTTRSTHSPSLLGASNTSYTASQSPFKLRPSLKMSIAQTYFLAHKARAKLSSEAARPDHNLRLLVGHANLLDSLMLDLADAEREQDAWFNQSVRGASPHSEERHVQWADSIVEEPEHDWRAEDAESDSDSDSDCSFDEDEDIEMADAIALRRIPSHTMMLSTKEEQYYDEDFDMEDEDDYAQLALQRTHSHSSAPTSPPELDDDNTSESSSDDETLPVSPPTTTLPTFDNKKSTTPPTPQHSEKNAFYEEGFYLPPRNPTRIVSSISVY